MSFLLALTLLTLVTSITCALPGTLIVLQRQSMLIDAMSHAVLPGIAIGALLSHSTHSPIMTLLAAVMGLVVVGSAQFLKKTGILMGDANQGLVFPALFALGVLLMSTVLSDVHVCQDTVLTGDLNLMAMPAEHVILADLSFGPLAMWRLLTLFVITSIFMAIMWRVLFAHTFDPQSARVMGLPGTRTTLVFMLLVSMTVVTAFDTAGAILVVALMIVPPATALLIATRIRSYFILTLIIAAFSAILGLWISWALDLPTTSMMAFIEGIVFILVWIGREIQTYIWRRKLASLA